MSINSTDRSPLITNLLDDVEHNSRFSSRDDYNDSKQFGEKLVGDDRTKSAKQSWCSTKECCGLTSKDDKVRTYARRMWCASFVMVLGIVSALVFLVVIPVFVRDLVATSDIIVQSVTIVNPSDTSFQSTVVQKFSKSGPISATVDFNSISISFSQGPGERSVTFANQYP